MNNITHTIKIRGDFMIKKSIILFFILTLSLLAETIIGKVVYVSDGDTIHLQTSTQKYKIRFYGIDTPEKTQNFGLEAKEFTHNRIFGKTVDVEVKDTDRYGRKVGIVYYNGKNLNLELVKNGYAWWYRQYAKNDVQLKKAEEFATRHKLGLWKQTNPLAPWDYRHGKRNTQNKFKQVKNESNQKIENVVYVTKNGKKYHRSTCRYAAKAITSMPRSEAETLGYQPCKICF